MKNLEEWKSTTLKKFLEKNHVSDETVTHVLDFLEKNPEIRLTRLSFPQAQEKAKLWKINQEQNNEKQIASGLVETVMTFPNNWRIVRLNDAASKIWEGKYMRHCVGNEEYWNNKGIYSLRDKNQMPHFTLEINGRWVEQINGKENKIIAKKYRSYLIEFLQKKELCLADCELCDRFEYIDLSPEEIVFRRKCFIDPKECILDNTVYGPETTENLVIDPSGYLSEFKRKYPSFFKKNIKNLSLEIIFDFFIIKNNIEAQKVLIELFAKDCMSFISNMLDRAIIKKRYESVEFLMGLLPQTTFGDNFLEYVRPAVTSSSLKVLKLLKSKIPDTKIALNTFYSVVLRHAIYKGNLEISKWVLEDYRGNFSYHNIIEILDCCDNNECLNFIKEIVKSCTEDQLGFSRRIADSFMQKKHTPFIELMLNSGLKPKNDEDKIVLLVSALKAGYFENIDYLMKQGYQPFLSALESMDEFLPQAVRRRDTNMVNFLINNGIKKNPYYFEALYRASQQEQGDILNILVNNLKN